MSVQRYLYHHMAVNPDTTVSFMDGHILVKPWGPKQNLRLMSICKRTDAGTYLLCCYSYFSSFHSNIMYVQEEGSLYVNLLYYNLYTTPIRK